MKKVHLLTFLLIAFAGNLLAQTQSEINEIKKRTNVQKLTEIGIVEGEVYKKNKAKAYRLAKEKGWITKSEKNGTIVELQGIDANGQPIYYVTDNENAAVSTATNLVYEGGEMHLALSGAGFTVAEWDGGSALETHQEFNNMGFSRVLNKDNSTPADHATHVAGTLIAGGVNPAAKGMAYNGYLHSYDWNGDVTEMTSAASNSLLISNHSYGLYGGWVYDQGTGIWSWVGSTNISNEEDYRFGYYDYWAGVWDDIARAAPYYLIVKSAGNDRGDWDGSSTLHPKDGGAGGFDCMTSKSVSKNILTVGAVRDVIGGYSGPNSVTLTSFSSTGPADDGRIKPDICGNGQNVYSSVVAGDASYGSKSGTSMSGPNVAGSLLLLQEHWNDLHTLFMKAATLKALVIHTAAECGATPGPDYKFGWGLLQTAAAANVITQKGFTTLMEDVAYNGTTYTLEIQATGTEPLVATLVYADPKGTPPPISLDPPNKMLVNDLDMTISNNGTTHYPYTLDPNNPAAAATTGDNDLDNVEKIYIENPIAGATYTITINHEGTLSGAIQQFSLIVSGITTGYALLTTADAQNVSAGAAELGGEVLQEGNSPVTENGIVWATSPLPTMADNVVPQSSGTGAFSGLVTGLPEATKIYYRAYATSTEGTSYGESKVFSTTCSIISTLSWEDDFASQEFSACYWQEILTGSTNWVLETGNGAGSPAAAYSGDYNLLLKSSSTAGNKTLLVLPSYNFTGRTGASMSFQYAQYKQFSWQDEFKIMYKTALAAPWQEVATFDNQATSWTAASVFLPESANAPEYYIAIEGNALGGRGIAIDNIVIDEAVSTDNLASGNILIYPNPSNKGVYNIQLNENFKATQVTVSNITGKEILNFKTTKNKSVVNLSKFPKGIYILKIQKGNNTLVSKLIYR